MADEVDERTTQSWLVLIILAVLSFGYITLFLWVIDVNHSGLDVWGKLRVLPSWLRDLSLNEVGDFFAGAFAPLAFIWLAGTVYIQTRELEAQRRELRENRKVNAATRDHVQAQAESMNQQALILGQQRHEQERQFNKTSQERNVAQLVAILNTAVAGNLSVRIVGRDDTKLLLPMPREKAHRVDPEELTTKFANAVKGLRSEYQFDQIELLGDAEFTLQNLWTLVRKLHVTLHLAEPELRVKLHRYKMDQIIEGLQWLLNKDDDDLNSGTLLPFFKTNAEDES